MNISIQDLKNEIKHVLVYPREKVSTREDAARLLQLKLHEFDKLRREGHFPEVQINGHIFFDNKDLFNWAHKHRPWVIDLRMDFEN